MTIFIIPLTENPVKSEYQKIPINKKYKQKRMYNGVHASDTLSRLKQQYQAIYEQNSSFRQSLLVSPYCSKFQKQQSPPQSIYNNGLNNAGDNNSLLDYIRPFESQQLNKTETKQKMRKKNYYEQDNRKKTQPDFQTKNPIGQTSYESFIHELRSVIRQKDERISFLEKHLSELGLNRKIANTQATVSGSPQMSKYRHHHQYSELKNSVLQKQQKRSENSISQKQNYFYLEAQLKNYKKQIRFLTHNNQQLYEQLQRINQYCEKLKKTLSTTLMYSTDLEEKFMEIQLKNQELSQLNQTLLAQKQEMMANYQVQMKLFKKMKKVWQQQNRNSHKQTSNQKTKPRQLRCQPQRSKSSKYKPTNLNQ